MTSNIGPYMLLELSMELQFFFLNNDFLQLQHLLLLFNTIYIHTYNNKIQNIKLNLSVQSYFYYNYVKCKE